MIKITYDSETGHTCPDGLIKAFVLNYIKKNNSDNSLTHKITVGSGLIIDEFRLQVKLGNLNKDDIIFLCDVDGTTNAIYVDKFGNLSDYPKSFCDYLDNLFMSLAGWA